MAKHLLKNLKTVPFSPLEKKNSYKECYALLIAF